MLPSLLPLFISSTTTQFCVISFLAFDNWGQKYCETLGHKPLLAINSTEKGQWPVPIIRDKNIHAVCCKDNYVFQRENLNYLIICFTWCTLLFQYVCFLLPICLPCFSWGAYCNEGKCCFATHRAVDISVAWLVYVRTYCVPIATLNQSERDCNILSFGYVEASG